MSTYREASPEGATLVAFLNFHNNSDEAEDASNLSELSTAMQNFRIDVEASFPGRFSWMSIESLHCTIRSLDL